LKHHGVTEVVINLHYEPESIRGLVGDGSRHGLKVHYSEEAVILGTAGGLKKAEPLLRESGSFFLVNSDSLTDCDLTAALKKHREAAALATLVLVPVRPGTDYGLVEVDERDRIARISGRPPGEPDPQSSRYHFSGVHVLEPQIFEAIPPAGKSEINSQIYPRLIGEGRTIRGFVHTGFWRELGNPALYLEGALAYLKATRDPHLDSIRASEGVYLDRTSLPEGTVVDPPLIVGRGAAVERGCSFMGGVIIGRQARLGKGCSLRSTIVWDGARIGEGTCLSECIVTSGVYVPPGVSLAHKIFLRAEGYTGKKDRLERIGSCLTASL
jgi:mannose-1-phosphate guanylyltransferase/phosphomannomutase